MLGLNKMVQNSVKEKLKRAYDIKDGMESSIPHYSIMSDPDLQIKPLILGRIPERERKTQEIFISKEKEKILIDQCVREYYLKNIRKGEDEETFYKYFVVIKDALLEIDELWKNDYLCYLKWSKERNKFIEIQFDGESYWVIDGNEPSEIFEYSEWMKSKCKFPEDYSEYESERFIKWAEKRIKSAQKIFPIKFRYSINHENNTLRLEDVCKFIQLESLFNPSILRLYKVKNKDTSEKKLSERKDSYLGKQYTYLEMKKRLEEIGKNNCIDQEDIYGMLVEKMTGGLLCDNFLYYYNEIYYHLERYNLPDGVDHLYVHELLLDVLNEFVEMPNVLQRRYILKELMEPVLYWKGDICKNLSYVANAAYLIKENYLEKWERMEEKEFKSNTKLLYNEKIYKDTSTKEVMKIYKKRKGIKNYKLINYFILHKL